MTYDLREQQVQAQIADLLSDSINHSQVDTQEYSYEVSRKRVSAIKVTAQNREGVLLLHTFQSMPERHLNQECGQLLRHSMNMYKRPIRAVIGVRVPERLRDITLNVLQDSPRDVDDYSYALWRSDNETIAHRFPEHGWLNGSLRDLSSFVRTVGFYGLRSRGVLSHIKQSVDEAARIVALSTAIDTVKEILHIYDNDKASRLATVILFDAAVFQYYVAGIYKDKHAIVSDPSNMVQEGSIGPGNVLAEWEQILKLDYYPIFGLATQILESVDDDEASSRVLQILYSAAVSAVAGTRNPQGLIGRLFGTLIADSKYLEMPYTSVSLASLMAELALQKLDIDWDDTEAIQKMRIADFACGTGAMLLATYQRIAARHRSEGGAIKNIHRGMMEDVLNGYDIDSTAIHLTAARLAGEHPRLPYEQCRLWALPYGQFSHALGPQISAGSLEMLTTHPETSIYGDGSIQMGSKGEIAGHMEHVAAESLDLVIMNPQTTRTSTTQPPIESIVQDRVDILYKELRQPLARSEHGGITACLFDLAHLKVRAGGVLALVLPVSFLTTQEWLNARSILHNHYKNITIIGTDDQQALSDDELIHEIVVIATKQSEDETSGTTENRYLILKTRPVDPIQAITIANTTIDDDGYLRLGTTVIGWMESNNSEHFLPLT